MRHGMVPKQRNRRHIGHPGKPSTLILAPNDLWSADFKGQFKTGNGRYCYPLTVGAPGRHAGVHRARQTTAERSP